MTRTGDDTSIPLPRLTRRGGLVPAPIRTLWAAAGTAARCRLGCLNGELAPAREANESYDVCTECVYRLSSHGQRIQAPYPRKHVVPA